MALGIRSVARIVWNISWWIHATGITSISAISAISVTTSTSQSIIVDTSLQAAREQEAAFLRDLYDALEMDQKSEAVHNWFRIDEICAFTGIQCDANGLVTIVDLSSKGLAGSLPNNFSSLTQLERLLLRNNEIKGTLPVQLPVSLMHFNVDRNRLEGTLPSFEFTTGALSVPSSSSKLERLIVSDNLLQGTVPPSLCHLTRLKALNLSRNVQLHGSLPQCLEAFFDLSVLSLQGTSLVPLYNTPSPTSSLVRVPSIALTPVPWALASSTPTLPTVLETVAPAIPIITYTPNPNTPVKKSTGSRRFPASPSHPFKWLPRVHNKFKSESNDSRPVSTPPSTMPSKSPFLYGNVDAVPSRDRASDRPKRPFYDGAAFLPVFSLLCLISMTIFFLGLLIIMKRVLKLRHFDTCGSLIPSAASDSSSSIANQESMEEEEIIFSKQDYLGPFNRFVGTIESEDSKSKWGCGCDVSTFHSSSINLQESATTPVTSRPCVVWPQTLAANPRVRFLLLAKSTSSTSSAVEAECPIVTDLDGPSDTASTESSGIMHTRDEIVTKRWQVTTCSPPSSLFCASSLMSVLPSTLQINSSPTATSQEYDHDSRVLPKEENLAPLSLGEMYQQLTINAVSSSFSSTTPMLNPIDCCHSSESKLIFTNTHFTRCRQDDNNAALQTNVGKYFPKESCTSTPPVQEVDCFEQNDVSFSWSTSNDGHAPVIEETYPSNFAASQNNDHFSFRPPRYYKKNVTRMTPHAVQQGQHEKDTEYSILGIRSPYSQEHHSDDDYEIELFEIEESKTDCPYKNRPNN